MGLILPTGSTAEIEEVSGNITVPEIAHDTEEDEYVVCIGYHCSRGFRSLTVSLVRD